MLILHNPRRISKRSVQRPCQGAIPRAYTPTRGIGACFRCSHEAGFGTLFQVTARTRCFWLNGRINSLLKLVPIRSKSLQKSQTSGPKFSVTASENSLSGVAFRIFPATSAAVFFRVALKRSKTQRDQMIIFRSAAYKAKTGDFNWVSVIR